MTQCYEIFRQKSFGNAWSPPGFHYAMSLRIRITPSLLQLWKLIQISKIYSPYNFLSLNDSSFWDAPNLLEVRNLSNEIVHLILMNCNKLTETILEKTRRNRGGNRDMFVHVHLDKFEFYMYNVLSFISTVLVWVIVNRNFG